MAGQCQQHVLAGDLSVGQQDRLQVGAFQDQLEGRVDRSPAGGGLVGVDEASLVGLPSRSAVMPSDASTARAAPGQSGCTSALSRWSSPIQVWLSACASSPARLATFQTWGDRPPTSGTLGPRCSGPRSGWAAAHAWTATRGHARPPAGDGWDGGNPESDVASSTTRARVTPRIRAASAVLRRSVISRIVRHRGVQHPQRTRRGPLWHCPNVAHRDSFPQDTRTC
jgi:hypothetical protein